jgi:hypothetical protein
MSVIVEVIYHDDEGPSERCDINSYVLKLLSDLDNVTKITTLSNKQCLVTFDNTLDNTQLKQYLDEVRWSSGSRNCWYYIRIIKILETVY